MSNIPEGLLPNCDPASETDCTMVFCDECNMLIEIDCDRKTRELEVFEQVTCDPCFNNLPWNKKQ